LRDRAMTRCQSKCKAEEAERHETHVSSEFVAQILPPALSEIVFRSFDFP
jgi:hypothetical protein